ncbi:hypothetical protein RCO27_00435 [Sphingosinicella sp. LHD-64]|uniref:hypothetical protein n=1 Tax=Sphingosinicella sp. LHD-64 TaxID=3072139 RepID=UPI00280D1BFB|nr:hypothetical protein [Sphingosinicella sp. LHD-64]MDQ8754684.1 hypothetical protein [Sphingosinicella sp. LHD-64]
MRSELRVLRRLALAFGLLVAATTAHGQAGMPRSGVSYDPPPVVGGPDATAASDAAEPEDSRNGRATRPGRARSDVQAYLEFAQVLSAELDGGETFTYSSVAAGVDGQIQTRRVRAQASYRYQRNIEWSGDVADSDIHSGIARVNADIVPGALQFDAGALATRTGGVGRALGVTDRDDSTEVYSIYAGPTLATHVGPVAVNAAYRLGYTAVDDEAFLGFGDDYDDSITHSATGSIGMGPGRLPFGWTVGAGHMRSDSGGPFDYRFEGTFVRGDVVVPVSPTLALTAGVGYEQLESSQIDLARDANGLPVVGPDGRAVPDPSRPRLLTYDVDGLIYDGGLIWRPTPRTELTARAGHRYGGTTIVGTFRHQFRRGFGVTAAVFDTVETFGGTLIANLNNLPTDFDILRNPFTGDLGNCAIGGQEPGSGQCFASSLQSIRGTSYRMRGASILFSGSRGLWDFGFGAGYAHRRFARPDDPAFDSFGGREDESFQVFGSVGRELSRTSQLGFDAYASWYSSDPDAFGDVTTIGGTLSYSRTFLFDRLQLIAALGLYHTDGSLIDSTVATGLIGLRYTFW